MAARCHGVAAEVDLQLPAGRRLEANRRPGLRQQLLPIRLDRPLHRPQTGNDTLLGRQLLPHHVGIPPVPAKPLAQPVVESIQEFTASRSLERLPATSLDVPLDRAPAEAELPRDPLRAPRVSRSMLERSEHLPEPIRAVAWRGVEGAGQALPTRSPPDGHRQGGCPHELGKVVTAIARMALPVRT